MRRQKPCEPCASLPQVTSPRGPAWCPGGLTAQKAFLFLPVITLFHVFVESSAHRKHNEHNNAAAFDRWIGCDPLSSMAQAGFAAATSEFQFYQFSCLSQCSQMKRKRPQRTACLFDECITLEWYTGQNAMTSHGVEWRAFGYDSHALKAAMGPNQRDTETLASSLLQSYSHEN